MAKTFVFPRPKNGLSIHVGVVAPELPEPQTVQTPFATLVIDPFLPANVVIVQSTGASILLRLDEDV